MNMIKYFINIISVIKSDKIDILKMNHLMTVKKG